MTQSIRTKDELLAIFADANPALVTKQNIRDFVVSNRVLERQVETSPQPVDAFTDFFIADVGCNATTLPAIADYGDRTLTIANISGFDVTITPDGAETIDGESSITIIDQSVVALTASITTTNWRVLIDTQQFATPAEYALAYIEASAALTTILDGTFVSINESLVAGLNSADFSVSATEITYNGIEDKIFAVDVAATAEKSGGVNQQYSYAVAVNDLPLSPIVSDTVANVFDSVSIVGVIALSTNDTVKVMVRGDSTTDSLNVKDLNLRLTEIPQ
jgi:hypothetical protein